LALNIYRISKIDLATHAVEASLDYNFTAPYPGPGIDSHRPEPGPATIVGNYAYFWGAVNPYIAPYPTRCRVVVRLSDFTKQGYITGGPPVYVSGSYQSDHLVDPSGNFYWLMLAGTQTALIKFDSSGNYVSYALSLAGESVYAGSGAIDHIGRWVFYTTEGGYTATGKCVRFDLATMTRGDGISMAPAGYEPSAYGGWGGAWDWKRGVYYFSSRALPTPPPSVPLDYMICKVTPDPLVISDYVILTEGGASEGLALDIFPPAPVGPLPDEMMRCRKWFSSGQFQGSWVY
jgi:hypothetical protein